MMLGSNCFHNIYMNHANLDNNVKYDNINYLICPGKGCLLSASVMIAILIPHLDFLWLEIIL
uniref:Uncharacterized protein n=1 Tax=Anguilla anguilla TaxID=7936 RepID=A0A0E9UAW1_ANGAN